MELAIAGSRFVAPLRQKRAGRVELLDPIGIYDVDRIARRAARNRDREVDLAVATPAAAPLRKKRSVGVELLHSVVEPVRDVHRAGAVDADPARAIELTVPSSVTSPRREKLAGRVELLDPVVEGVDDEDRA